jgi:hypothetical protein
VAGTEADLSSAAGGGVGTPGAGVGAWGLASCSAGDWDGADGAGVFGVACPQASVPSRTHSSQFLRIILPPGLVHQKWKITKQEILAQSRGIARTAGIRRDWNHREFLIGNRAIENRFKLAFSSHKGAIDNQQFLFWL